VNWRTASAYAIALLCSGLLLVPLISSIGASRMLGKSPTGDTISIAEARKLPRGQPVQVAGSMVEK